jgi:hypothetical protein
VFVLFDIGEDVDLVDRALLQFFVLLEPPHLDHLHRVLLAVVFVYRPVDLPVGALADYLVERVVLDYAHHSQQILLTESKEKRCLKVWE